MVGELVQHANKEQHAKFRVCGGNRSKESQRQFRIYLKKKRWNVTLFDDVRYTYYTYCEPLNNFVYKSTAYVALQTKPRLLLK